MKMIFKRIHVKVIVIWVGYGKSRIRTGPGILEFSKVSFEYIRFKKSQDQAGNEISGIENSQVKTQNFP